jgi:hypothetical protein
VYKVSLRRQLHCKVGWDWREAVTIGCCWFCDLEGHQKWADKPGQWYTPVIPALKQEDHKFKASLGYILSLRPAWAIE